VRNLRHQWIVGVRVGEHRADREQDWRILDTDPYVRTIEPTFRDGKCWRPLISQNVKTNTAVGIDVGVVDASGEVNLRRLEWIVGGKCDTQEKYAGGVWAVGL
jgi:hypothetical protein